MKILLIDNYDSFTYNLVHSIEQCNIDALVVIRNDEVQWNEIEKYDRIIFSPGPGLPKDAGWMPRILHTFSKQKPMLGICLGMQAIVEEFGGKLRNLIKPLHGIPTPIRVLKKEDPIFNNLPEYFTGGHYHSWVADPQYIPESIEVTAIDSYKNVMAVRHKTLPIHGLQFHPESVLSSHGNQIIKNWIDIKF